MLPALASSLRWVLAIPNEIRHAILESRATHDPATVPLEWVEQVRWYERSVVASRREQLETFFVIVYLGGRYRVVRDSADGELRRRLTLANMLPARPTWLGTSHTAVAWAAWVAMIAILVATIAAIAVVLRHC